MSKVLEYAGTNKPVYPMDVILNKQKAFEEAKQKEADKEKDNG